MEINFFEEYPTEENLSKLQPVDFKTRVYLGFENAKDFVKTKHEIESHFKGRIQVGYWPLLKLREGYWLSAFSKNAAIKRVVAELERKGEKFSVVWDAEFPLLEKKLFVSEFLNMFSNRKLINTALTKSYSSHPVVVAEFPRSRMNNFLAELGGVTFPFTSYHRLDMLYTSMMKTENKENYMKQIIRGNLGKYKNYSVGLGLLERGEGDLSPLLTPDELERDLKIAKQERVKEIVLYRLGGLNKEYLKVLKKYA